MPPDRHALVVAAHALAHAPLARIGDMLDVALLADRADRETMAELAAAWNMRKVWSATMDAVDALLLETKSPRLALNTWARHLVTARERTVFESHLEDWLSSFWALPFPIGLWALAAELASEALPVDGEAWSMKLRRSATALRHAFVAKSEHDQILRSDDVEDERRGR